MQQTAKYVDENGVTRWVTDRKFSKEELEQQREEFEKDAKEGKRICLTDLFINHGM